VVYDALYDRVQSCDLNIGFTRVVCKNKIRDEVKRLTDRNVRHIRAGRLRAHGTRGVYLRAPRTGIAGDIIQGPRTDVILTPAALKNTKMERFIYIKELMHCFENEAYFTVIPEHLRSLVQNIPYEVMEKTEQTKSDMAAHWLALSVMCVERDRVQILEEISGTREKDYTDMTEEFEIPEEVIGGLFEDRYEDKVYEAKQRFT